MMKLKSLPALVATAVLTLSCAPVTHSGPPSADAIVAAATTRARGEDKTVLIEFGASWCVWCRNFQAFVHAPDTGPIVTKHFVVVNLTVEEREDKVALENPGASDAKTKWGGEKAGLPFYVFLNQKGDAIATSNAMPDGSNIGFPAVPAEIDAFMTLVDKTAPKLTTAERAALKASLVKTMPPPAS